MPPFTLHAPVNAGNKALHFLMGLGISLLIGVLDAVTGSDISFFIFYLIPIFYVAWTNGFAAGITISVLDILMWVGVNIIWPLPIHFNHVILEIFSVAEKVISIGLFLGITAQLRAALVREKAQARIDPQTGLGNHYALSEALEKYMQQDGATFAISCFDLEGLDSVYLSEGRPTIDKIFRITSLLLKRRVHRCFRIQDDSFVALLDEPHAEEAKVKTHNLRDLIQTDLKTHHGYEVSVDACVLYVSNATAPHRILEHMHECLRKTKLRPGSEPIMECI